MQFEYDNLPAIKTEAGFVKGYQFDGTYIFKGVPYADAERFQMPTSPKAWEGVRETASYGMVCPLLFPEKPNGELMVPHMYWPQDEHCQTLNIWTQHLDTQAKKPVVVWFHGGGWFAGSAIEQLAYDGANLSKDGDVVVVTVNHRLNILGFMDLSPFGEKYKNSANAGIADMVAALRWIKNNIAEFGGDPNNVTIFGQSGGGMKVSALMQCPEAEGLFHKGIVMSGVAGDFMPACTGSGEEIVKALMTELHLESVEQLETVPYPMLAGAYFKVFPSLAQQGKYVGNNPRIDDYYLGEPQMTHFTEQAKKTPLIIGTVFGEMSFGAPEFNKYEMSEEQMEAMLQGAFKENTPKVIEAFKKAYPDKKITDVLSIDTIFRPLTKIYANAKAEHREAPTYNYVFAPEFTMHHGKPAWHCSDIPFLFNNIDKVPSANIPGAEELQEQIYKSLVAFAYTGNPNHEGLPTWESCTPGREVTMVFDTKNTEARVNFDNELVSVLGEVLPKVTIDTILAAMTDIQH